MKIHLHTGFPILAALACAAIALAVPVTTFAEDAAAPAAAAPDAQAQGSPDTRQSDTQKAVSAKAGAFQGLMPPATRDENAATSAVPLASGSADRKDDQSGNRDDAPPVTYGAAEPADADTYPPLMMTPDKAELVRLDADAASVVTGSPENLNIQMETRRLMILTPASPGATYMTVLDSNGHVIMQRHVIVGAPKNTYIRIRRSCAGQSGGCQETSVYYCDGMCHAVGSSPAMPSSSGANSAGGGASSGASADSGSGAPPMTSADAPQAKMTVNPAAAVTPGY